MTGVEKRIAMPEQGVKRARQRRLFCSCGAGVPAVAGLCRACYAQAARSRTYFGGHREIVLERDGRSCRICGAGNQRVVHHRRRGENAPELLITVCPACHARIHRLAAIRHYVPEELVPFWTEQHPGVALQLQLALETLD
jgi:hypothetical protein